MTNFDGFFQFGYIGRDIDGACETLARCFGVTQVCRRQHFDWLNMVYAWVGDTMIEVIVPEAGRMAIYDPFIPDDPAQIKLHHHGFRTRDIATFEQWRAATLASGTAIPVEAETEGGQIKVFYADVRPITGIFHEHILMTGGVADTYYADVPHN